MAVCLRWQGPQPAQHSTPPMVFHMVQVGRVPGCTFYEFYMWGRDCKECTTLLCKVGPPGEGACSTAVVNSKLRWAPNAQAQGVGQPLAWEAQGALDVAWRGYSSSLTTSYYWAVIHLKGCFRFLGGSLGDLQCLPAHTEQQGGFFVCPIGLVD